jgi:N-methylhydantoinase A/oxoprolinase/acetone carboxylase beta subunit
VFESISGVAETDLCSWTSWIFRTGERLYFERFHHDLRSTYHPRISAGDATAQAYLPPLFDAGNSSTLKFPSLCLISVRQNDGTLITAIEAARLPVRTFSSGATNSMRGASYLSGIDLKKKGGAGKSMIVVDIGGTTTDVGVVLPSGFPRQAAAFIEGERIYLLCE